MRFAAPTQPAQRRLACQALLAGLALLAPRAARAQGPANDLTGLSLEELMQVEVVSVVKHAEPAFETPAAVYVLTREELRRSGARTVPEALSLVPGLFAGRIDASKWAISARGFNSRFARTLLVLVDGRSIYTPIYSGVAWEGLTLPLEEIERIEVIRGPGGTLWGTNAVNGVINIITRRPSGEPSVEVALGAGNDERRFADTALSGPLPGQGRYRLWGSAAHHGSLTTSAGSPAGDAWSNGGVGLRTEWSSGSAGTLSVEGGASRSDLDTRLRLAALEAPFHLDLQDRRRMTGQHLLARWSRTLPGQARVTLQGFLADEERSEALLRARLEVGDIDTQVELPAYGRHQLSAGAGFRRVRDRLAGALVLSFAPERKTTSLWSGFLQDQIELWKHRATLTLGSKVEHSDPTGLSFQPSLRLLGRLSARQTAWLAVSRAVRTPSRAELDLDSALLAAFPSADGAPIQVALRGNPDLQAETLVAWEAGWRFRPTGALSLDVAAFRNRYSALAATIPVSDPAERQGTMREIASVAAAATSGVELGFHWRPCSRFALEGSYSRLDLGRPRLRGTSGTIVDYSSAPRNQAQLRLRADLPFGLELDAGGRYRDSIRNLALAAGIEGDLRLAYPLSHGVEIELIGRDLLSGPRREFASTGIGEQASLIRSRYLLTLRWKG